MGRTQILVILVASLTSVFAIMINETIPNQSSEISTSKELESATTEPVSSVNATSRRGRHIMIDRIELPAPVKKTKRQIIKIPSDVSKVKLVRPPLNLRHNRAPQQFKRFPPGFRGSNPRRPNSNRGPQEDDYDYDGYNGNVVKRNSKRPKIKEVTRQEFYEDDDFEFEREVLNQISKNKKNQSKGTRSKRKNPKKSLLREYIAVYDEDERPNRQNQEAESSRNRYRGTSTYEDQTIYGFDSASSNVHVKQVHPSTNAFGLKIVNPPEVTVKQSQTFESSDKFNDYIPNIQKLPTKGRQIQSLFSQQYTTHNPNVATNFGLTSLGSVNGYQYVPKGSYIDATPFSFSTTLGKYNQPTMAASDQVVTALPALNPGIQVIQPPQFRDVTVSHPSHPSRLMSSLSQQSQEASSQKATIRDILDQDCPAYDVLGYCESPPRYPMHQIDQIVKKCANLMEAMNTQPFDEPQDIFGFSSRSDQNYESDNKTISTDFEHEKLSSWSRSGYESTTACHSELHITEPGYAKEVISGRWFVIVQNPDTTIQRVTTDTCKNPGKSCGGLLSLKCSKGNKSTRCVQRFTHQKLISWDPESPDACPRIRVFRFPSACLCNLGII